MYKLHNELRHYAWGSRTAMAELFNREPSGEPEAELWIGAHPDSPSQALVDGVSRGLDAVVAANPQELLGSDVAHQYGRLPFLMKVLAAGSPLSLQVHPTLAQARAGFAAENAAGVARDASDRNYRDDNHKPEMLYALTDFTALCGFRPPSEAAVLLRRLAAAVTSPEVSSQLQSLSAILEEDATENALRTVFERLLTSDDDAMTFRGACDQALAALAAEEGTDLALSTAASLAKIYPQDSGPVISLLLNVVTLQPGDAIWLPAGNVHAYLQGLGIEVMSSSDNVLRGGLTGKHVDVPELMKTVDFRALTVPRMQVHTEPTGEELLQPPCREFQLQRITFSTSDAAPVPLAQNGPAVVLAVHGGLRLVSGQDELLLGQGDSAFVPASQAPVRVTPSPECGASAGLVEAFAVTVQGVDVQDVEVQGMHVQGTEEVAS